ncbi:MAG: hypothetical protein ACMG51_06140 [Ginsengibacter sp.]
MKLRTSIFSLVFILFSFQTNAQALIAFSTGISTDLNNVKPFYMIPLSIRIEPFKRSSFFVEVIQGFGFNKLSKADAYTTNPQLPEHLVLTEVIKSTSFSMGIGWVIKIYTDKKNNRFALNLSAGGSDENFRINYKNYDKVNYEVLNPDVSTKFSGVYAAIAAVYNFHKGKQDMFINLRLQTPLSGRPRADTYVLSFYPTAPIELTYGYKLFSKK